MEADRTPLAAATSFRSAAESRLRKVVEAVLYVRLGTSSERAARLIDQLELQLADLEESAAASELAAEAAISEAKIEVSGFARRKPARRPLPEHLPRERVVYPAPSACPWYASGEGR
jgi:transposase